MLTRLWHLTITGGDDNNRAVQGGGAGDHVLDVIGVAWAVDVGVVAFGGLVLDVGGGDGDAALALFGGFVNGIIGEVVSEALFCLALGDGGSEGGLPEIILLALITLFRYVRVCTFPWST